MKETTTKSGQWISRFHPKKNALSMSEPALVSLTHPSSVFVEQYRVLYQKLERYRQRQKLQLVSFTSAVAGEGKSVTATNLAWIASTTNPHRRILLVDADLRGPRIGGLLGVETRPGLSELLRGESTPQEVLRNPRGSTLTVLPAGTPHQEGGQLVSSSSMRSLLEQVRQQFDEIYLDVPPVLPVADGVLLASSSDGVILVVRAGMTSRSVVWQAVESLTGTVLLGCVLNGVEVSEVPGI
jgi:capsular exopolysaccharide synthesis family protein